jgi:N-methylhydantoinase A
MAGAVVELVSLRAIGIGRTVKPDVTVAAVEPHAAASAPTPVATRSVRVARDDASLVVDVHSGVDLRPGATFAGPALVDGADTTVWVPPGSRARVDGRNNLVVEVA